MKLSLSAAMRARDISRPHDEHMAAAESTEPAPNDAEGNHTAKHETRETPAVPDPQPPRRSRKP